MSISSEITLLNNTKQAIKASINAKGGNITNSTPFADYSTAIDNLPSGGSGNPLIESIDVSDFTGTTFNDARTYITDVTIPSGVTSIGNSAFSGFTSLTSIDIPSGVTSIGNYSFDNCTGLTSVTVPSGVTNIGQYAFQRCTGLTSVTIPDSVTIIDHGAFKDTNSPIKVTIGSGVIAIGTSAFQNIANSGSVIIKATTPPTIYDYTFFGLYPIYVPAASVDAYKAANNWSTYASRIFAIGDAITFTPTNGDPAISVKNYELVSANYVQSTDVPATIKNGAGSLEISEGVDRIGISAFRNSSSLTSVTLPSTLTRIDELAFDGCSSLTSVTVNATTPPTLYAAAFGGSYPIYVPASSVDAYKAASGWSTYESRIQAVTYRLATLTLSDNAEVEITSDTTTLTRALVSTPYNATLVSASIAPNTTMIGDRTFFNCTLMTSVTFESGSACETIYTRAFSGCSGLTSITLPNTVTQIDEYAFQATALTSITIPDSVTQIGQNAFIACESLESATIGNGVETIWASAFINCPSLENVTIGSGLTEIGEGVFAGCESLTSVTMLGETPPSLIDDADPFAYGDSGINTLYVPAASVSDYQTWVDEILGADSITVEAIPAE